MLISKTDATVIRCDFTVNHLVSILLKSSPSHNRSVGNMLANPILDSEGWWFKTNSMAVFFPGYDQITYNLNFLDQYFMV